MTTLETEAKQSMGKSFALTVRASTQVAMDIVAVVIPFSSILMATRCPKITRKLKLLLFRAALPEICAIISSLS